MDTLQWAPKWLSKEGNSTVAMLWQGPGTCQSCFLSHHLNQHYQGTGFGTLPRMNCG